MKKLGQILLAVAVAMVALGAWQVDVSAKGEPDSVKFDGGKKGAVTFDHKKHAKDRKIECATCHHQKDKKDKACRDCHKAKKAGDAVVAKKAFHKTCKTCHKKEGKGPTKCKDCHKK